MDRSLIVSALEKLRWGVHKAREQKLSDKFTLCLRLLAPQTSTFVVVLRNKVNLKETKSIVLREDVETRGKSCWFNDNTWRLSPGGIEKFADQLAALFNDPRAAKFIG